MKRQYTIAKLHWYEGKVFDRKIGTFQELGKETFENIEGKGENADDHHFLLFFHHVLYPINVKSQQLSQTEIVVGLYFQFRQGYFFLRMTKG